MKPDATALANSARAATRKGQLPPVHLWDPPFCGDLDMRIARDGTWFYQGTPIGRPALTRLFSTILVDDVPFVAVDFERVGADLVFETNMGDRAMAGPDHALRVVVSDAGAPSPYVHVRAGLEARIDRKTFYRLVALGVHHDGWFGVWSGDVFFPFVAPG